MIGPKYIVLAMGVFVLGSVFPSQGTVKEGLPWLDCLIEPYMVVELASPVIGIVESISVDRGSFIERGQVVATLEAEIERADVALSRARLEYNERKYARSEELYEKRIMSASEKELAETEKKMAEMELHRSEELLKLRTIRSPVTGVVVERFISPGEVARQEKILEIAQINPLNVEVIVPVSMFGSLRRGMRAEVKGEDLVNQVYRGRIKMIDRVVDAASGTFGVRVELANPRYKIPAGIKCKVRFYQ